MIKYNTLQELFADSKRWTKGSYAKDKENKYVCFDSENACRWCLVGGIRLVYGYTENIDWNGNCTGYSMQAQTVINKINDYIKGKGYYAIPGFNDSSTHANILKLVKKLNI